MGRSMTADAVPAGTEAGQEVLPVLVCDLDGSLIRTDLLFETFWAAFSSRWTAPVPAVWALLRGRAALKAHLAGAVEIDVTCLPYESAVLDEVRAWRARGGRTALVTAADQGVARRVAAHLGLFDEVHGSDGTRNLKGREKAGFLERRFGRGGYRYIGDRAADLPVWEGAADGITVNAPAGLRRAAEARCEMRHLGTARNPAGPMIRALRPHQWAKNLLVFLPLLAGHAFGGGALFQALMAFVAFSLVASSVYVMNDLLDLEADRAHPRKRLRPFASGDLSLRHGTWMAPVLLALGVATGVLLGPLFVLVLAGYYVTTTLYSLWLKRKHVIDICTLAALYVLRIIAGALAAGIDLSQWLLAFSTFFFFALAAVKRQAELVDGLASGREVSGRGYMVEDLPLVSMMAIASGYVSVMVMALYVTSPDVTQLYSRPEALWGICAILLYWLSRLVFITHRGRMHDDPVVFAARDRLSHVLFLAALACIVGGTVL